MHKKWPLKKESQKNNFHNGLQLLIDNGLIEKGGHGDYKVISDNSKLIV